MNDYNINFPKTKPIIKCEGSLECDSVIDSTIKDIQTSIQKQCTDTMDKLIKDAIINTIDYHQHLINLGEDPIDADKGAIRHFKAAFDLRYPRKDAISIKKHDDAHIVGSIDVGHMIYDMVSVCTDLSIDKLKEILKSVEKEDTDGTRI